jgi:hypothetical protein
VGLGGGGWGGGGGGGGGGGRDLKNESKAHTLHSMVKPTINI